MAKYRRDEKICYITVFAARTVALKKVSLHGGSPSENQNIPDTVTLPLILCSSLARRHHSRVLTAFKMPIWDFTPLLRYACTDSDATYDV